VREGQRLVSTFPYVEGAFRDTFIRRPTTHSWPLLLASQPVNGKLDNFCWLHANTWCEIPGRIRIKPLAAP